MALGDGLAARRVEVMNDKGDAGNNIEIIEVPRATTNYNYQKLVGTYRFMENKYL